MNRGNDTSRHLLFGLLALQNGLIDQAPLVAAFQAWTRDKARPLADHLVARGDLDAEHRPLLEALAAAHLETTAATSRGAWRHPRRPLDPREPGPARRPRRSRATLARVGSRHSDRAGRRRRPHGQLRRRHGHRRRPAVPRPPAARPGRPGRRLRGAGRRAAPRGGAEADPRPPRRRPDQPPAVPAGGRDHRRAGAPGDRPGLRPGHLRRRPALLRHAVHPGRQLKEAIERFHADDGAEERPRPPLAGAAQAAAAVHSTSATRSTTPTAAACCTATSSRATSSSASTARRWWSTGAWPRPPGRAEPDRRTSGR